MNLRGHLYGISKGTNCSHNKYLHKIRAHNLQYFSSYTPKRHPQDAGHRTLSPTTPYYKLTGKLKSDQS